MPRPRAARRPGRAARRPARRGPAGVARRRAARPTPERPGRGIATASWSASVEHAARGRDRRAVRGAGRARPRRRDGARRGRRRLGGSRAAPPAGWRSAPTASSPRSERLLYRAAASTTSTARSWRAQLRPTNAKERHVTKSRRRTASRRRVLEGRRQAHPAAVARGLPVVAAGPAGHRGRDPPARRGLRADERRRLQAALLRRSRRARRPGHRHRGDAEGEGETEVYACRRRPTTCRPSSSRPTSSRRWPPACSCSSTASPTASRCAWRC